MNKGGELADNSRSQGLGSVQFCPVGISGGWKHSGFHASVDVLLCHTVQGDQGHQEVVDGRSKVYLETESGFRDYGCWWG